MNMIVARVLPSSYIHYTPTQLAFQNVTTCSQWFLVKVVNQIKLGLNLT